MLAETILQTFMFQTYLMYHLGIGSCAFNASVAVLLHIPLVCCLLILVGLVLLMT